MKSSAAIMVALISLGPSATQEALGFDGSPVNTDPLPDSLPDSLKRFAAASKIANNTRADSFFDPALTQLRVYLTAPVQDDFRRVSASKFSEGAEKAGFSSFEAKSFSDSMASGEIRFEPGGQLGSIVLRDASLRIG